VFITNRLITFTRGNLYHTLVGQCMRRRHDVYKEEFYNVCVCVCVSVSVWKILQ
jgi:hypothetical protein